MAGGSFSISVSQRKLPAKAKVYVDGKRFSGDRFKRVGGTCSGRRPVPQQAPQVAGDELRLAPGEGHHYADTNYILLGMIVGPSVLGLLRHGHVTSFLADNVLKPFLIGKGGEMSTVVVFVGVRVVDADHALAVVAVELLDEAAHDQRDVLDALAQLGLDPLEATAVQM